MVALAGVVTWASTAVAQPEPEQPGDARPDATQPDDARPDEPSPSSALPIGQEAQPLPEAPGASKDDGPKPWAVGVSEESRRSAIKRFRGANEFFERGQYGQAAKRYRRALMFWEHPAIHYNLAISLINIGNPVEAHENLIRALEFGARPIGPRLFKEGKTYLKLLEAQLSTLVVESTYDGAIVSLDGKDIIVGKTSSKHVLRPGAHQVVVRKDGYATTTRTLTLLAGKSLRYDVRLTPLSEEVKMTRRWKRWQPYAVLGGGVAAILVGIPFQMKASDNYDAYERAIATQCPTGCSRDQVPSEVLDLKSTARGQNAVAISLFVAGTAAAVTGAAMLIMNQPQAASQDRRQPVAVSPMVGPDLAGVVATLRFD